MSPKARKPLKAAPNSAMKEMPKRPAPRAEIAGEGDGKSAAPKKMLIRKVEDIFVRKPGSAGPNSSAFRPPAHVPGSVEGLSPDQRRKLVTRMIPHPEPAPPEPVLKSLKALEPPLKRFHGMKIPLYWLPGGLFKSPCADKFGYMFSAAVRNGSKLPFTAANEALLNQLGTLIGTAGRPNPDSIIPAGYTYFGQFVDHDVTFDTTSTIDAAQDATTITNMRSPALDLDNVYGRGPALDPFLYVFPSGATQPTAVKMQLGKNTNTGQGGPGTTVTPSNFDVPRVDGTLTAIIGDPRNDENLIVSQFHHAMLKFHNAVVQLLIDAFFAGDIFAEAKKIATQHYQWCVVHDFLPRVCGLATVNNAIATVAAPIGSAFRMPVEFSVAAYRFGHSMIRDLYVLNHALPQGIASLDNVFAFNRVPNLPVFSNWALDFNRFFVTARPPADGVFNNAAKIDSNLSNGLERIPGGSGIMAILAARNLRRGLAMGLPSGQAAATAFGIAPLTAAQLTTGLPAAEVAILNSNGGLLLTQTPLWYYVLREAMVLQNGDQLGPVGGRIVAETFVRMLKRDAGSFMNVSGFAPSLPSSVPGTFTIADLLEFAGVLVQ